MGELMLDDEPLCQRHNETTLGSRGSTPLDIPTVVEQVLAAGSGATTMKRHQTQEQVHIQLAFAIRSDYGAKDAVRIQPRVTCAFVSDRTPPATIVDR